MRWPALGYQHLALIDPDAEARREARPVESLAAPHRSSTGRSTTIAALASCCRSGASAPTPWRAWRAWSAVTDHPFQRPTPAQIGEFLTAFPTEADREAFTAGTARTLFTITDPPRQDTSTSTPEVDPT